MTRAAAALLLAAAAVLAGACSEERARPDGGAVGRIHPVGITDEASADFHGRELARRGWDLRICARCHGDDFAGGAAGISCRTCHADGPDTCATCHRDGPTSGAHPTHLVAGRACDECHRVPARWDAAGHVLDDPPPAEVTFGAFAAITLEPADRAGPPAWDGERCSNVYCHGAVLHRGGGSETAPAWDAAAQPGGCTRCHGSPPPSHAPGITPDGCAMCHPDEPHLDGAVQTGARPGCGGCHGSETSAAPPRDLSGNEFTTAIGVGAHQGHLTVPTQLRGPVPCETCHQVPATLLAPGHLDTLPPAEVTPALGWDRAAQKCTTAWCHGPSKPVWTETESGMVCGECHGIPPETPSHTPGMPIFTCVACHAQTVGAYGQIIITPGPSGPTSEHMDGNVDFQ